VTSTTSTCAFCDAKLRGKKIAFDPERVRLWEICGRCGQWNMSPLETDERTRAVGELELRFRAAPEHGGSTAIGVARVGGSTLVRVGDASWREFAAWRYGKRLVHRRDRDILLLLINALVGVLPWGDRILTTTIALSTTGVVLGVGILLTWAYRPVCRIWLRDGRRARLTGRHERRARLVVEGETWMLRVRHDRGESLLVGRQAVRVLAILLARRNFSGAAKVEVATAIEMVERAGGSDRVFTTWLRPLRVDGTLRRLPKTLALALEMATHEQDERRGLEGELAALRFDMREAEKLGRIVEEELA